MTQDFLHYLNPGGSYFRWVCNGLAPPCGSCALERLFLFKFFCFKKQEVGILNNLTMMNEKHDITNL